MTSNSCRVLQLPKKKNSIKEPNFSAIFNQKGKNEKSTYISIPQALKEFGTTDTNWGRERGIGDEREGRRTEREGRENIYSQMIVFHAQKSRISKKKKKTSTTLKFIGCLMFEFELKFINLNSDFS